MIITLIGLQPTHRAAIAVDLSLSDVYRLVNLLFATGKDVTQLLQVAQDGSVQARQAEEIGTALYSYADEDRSSWLETSELHLLSAALEFCSVSAFEK